MLRRLAKDLAVYGAGDFVLKFISFAVFPIYAYYFSVREFGVLTLAAVAAGLIGIFVNIGLNNALQRFYWDPATEQEHRPLLVSTGLAVLGISSVTIVMLLVALLYPARDYISSRYGLPWSVVLLALITVVPTQILQYALDTLRLHFAKWKYLLVSFLKNLFGVLIGLLLIVRWKWGIEGFFWGGFAGALVGVPLALYLIRRDLTKQVRLDVVRQLVAYGYPFIFAGIAYWIFGAADRWMLAQFGDLEDVGLYSIAFKFAAILVFLSTAFAQAWSPLAIRVMRDDPDYRTTYSRVLTFWFFGLTGVGLAICLFARELIMLTTPREYWPAALLFGTVVMASVVSGTTQITAAGISIERKTSLLSRAAWVAAIANVALNWILIPRYGALGAGVATLLSSAGLTGMYLFWSQRLHPIPLEERKLLFCAATTVAVLPVAYLLNGQTPTPTTVLVKLLLLSLFVAGALLLDIVRPAAFVALRRADGWRQRAELMDSTPVYPSHEAR